MITDLEPDIVKYEVKWALGSITTNKASGGDGIPGELFQILKYDVLKCCTQYARKFGKLTSGHSTEIGQFSFQSQRKTKQLNGKDKISSRKLREHFMQRWAQANISCKDGCNKGQKRYGSNRSRRD